MKLIKYEVRFEKRAQKALKKMDKHQAYMIMSWMKKNLVDTSDPRQFGKGLKGNKSGEWRYRVGDYRIISHIDDEKIIILVLEIGHRRDIYN